MAERKDKPGITEWSGGGGGGGPLPRGGGGSFEPMTVRGRGSTPSPRSYIKGEASAEPRPSSIERAMGQAEQSIRDAGGYPTRGGKPMKTKMQERMDARRTANEEIASSLPVPTSQESWQQWRSRNKMGKQKQTTNYNKGGMVKGHCREYGK